LTELAEICDSVGIIEHGNLLAVGTVDEIQHGTTSLRAIRVRLLDRGQELVAWLEQFPQWSEVVADGEIVTLMHAGQREDEAQLLKAMVDAGFPVAEFGSHKRSLEDVFMHVTKGRVQ
ncbi:MAG: DUF4162 domain-containing protein, partial [Planctomycetales bacterium]|nr:DUF4162 domain-containing protein [Planctomycetales bacterium]